MNNPRKLGVLIGGAILVLGIGMGEYLYYSATQPTAAKTTTELHFGTLQGIAAQGKTSSNATSSTPLSKEFMVYTPDDPGDARVAIRDLATGKVCQSDNYLITRLVLSGDEKTLQVYNYSGSNSFIDTIDTTSCKRTAPRQSISVH